ncbi:MAG: hypothetical protein NC318_05165 [Blautia sp.]|nr:hypothetical protein [Lachnoclostridium sp.]MCM1210973.1 hypothetical protein [Blautia sp.]
MELKYYLRGLGLGVVVTAIIMGVASSRGRKMTDAEIIARAKQLGMTENTVLTDNAGKDDAADDLSGEQSPDTDKNAGFMGADGSGANAADDGQTAAVSDENALDGNGSGNDAADNSAGNDTAGNRPADENPGQDNAGSDEARTPDTDRENPDSEALGGADDPEEENAAGKTGGSKKPDDLENEDLEETDTHKTSKSVVIVIGSGDGSYAASKKLEDAGAIASAADFDTFLCENGYDKKIRTGTYTIPANASEEQMARIITGAE